MNLQNIFIHHVFFWLKNPSSSADAASLQAGLEKLSKAPTVRSFHIGKPAGTDRGVIDRSYAFSWMLVFDNAEQQARPIRWIPSTWILYKPVPISGRRSSSMIRWTAEGSLSGARRRRADPQTSAVPPSGA